MKYRVNDIYPSIQGEGVMTGTPMIFIRLNGCGVGCPWCDTKETWDCLETGKVSRLDEAFGKNGNWCEADENSIADAVVKIAEWTSKRGNPISWALITGGEPAEQDLRDLAFILRLRGFAVGLETSGTALGHVGAKFDHITASPKLGMKKPVLKTAVAPADELKFVVGKESDLEAIDNFLGFLGADTFAGKTISLQPVSMNQKATELCVKACLERNWNLSAQVHQLVRIP